MKKILLFLTFLLITTFTYSQSTHSIIKLAETDGVETSALYANHPYVGAKFGMNIAGNVRNSAVFDLKALKVFASGTNWAIPGAINIGLGSYDSLSLNGGFSAGVFPWYKAYTSSSFEIFLHGGLNYQIPDLVLNSEKTRLGIFAGVEADFYPADHSSPIVVSLTPKYVKDFFGTNTKTFGLEITGVVPVAKGVALIYETNIPFDKGISTGTNLGVLFSAGLQ